jgi:sulfur-oxidizing protein SoxY
MSPMTPFRDTAQAERAGRAASAACSRRAAGLAVALGLIGFASARAQGESDPFGSLQWPDLRRELLVPSGPVEFDPRVQVLGPPFAEDPMNVPITVSARGLTEVERIVVFVDRNPIRKVLEYFPLAALPAVSFRFKLEQASPVRAAVRTRDGRWHVGGTLVDSAGGGCTAPGQTRRDGSWSRSLGQVSARLFGSTLTRGDGGEARARLRVRVMHPMDTGLVGGVPAFYLNRLALSDAEGRLLARLDTFEPVSENPVFSFDLGERPAGALRLSGSDNNGNRIQGTVE